MQLAEEGADEAAKRHLIPDRVVAKGVQLRLLQRQRVVMTGQKAKADVLLHRLHYALPGRDAAAERRDAQDEPHSAAQARAWADGDFDADHGFAFDGVGTKKLEPERGLIAGRQRESARFGYYIFFLVPWPENPAYARCLKYLGVLNGTSVLKTEY